MQVGDLSGKYGDLAMKTDVSGSFVDPSLSLFGRLSVVRTGHCTGRGGAIGGAIRGAVGGAIGGAEEPFGSTEYQLRRRA